MARKAKYRCTICSYIYDPEPMADVSYAAPRPPPWACVADRARVASARSSQRRSRSTARSFALASTIEADGLVVLDMGSRAGPIVPGLPTIVVDHHDDREVPDVTVYVSGAGCEPVAPTALLAYVLLGALALLDDLGWLAWLGTAGDLGMAHPFADELAPIMARSRKTHVQKAVSLVNAARRSSRYRPELVLDVLLAARDPVDIARGTVPGVDALAACRRDALNDPPRAEDRDCRQRRLSPGSRQLRLA